jgi:soluble lytic murein transglycosylase
MRAPYRILIEEIAARHGLDPLLVEAVVWQESAGHADAFRFEPAYWERYCKTDARFMHEEPRRIASSYGLMQIMYPTALQHHYSGSPEGLFEIETNLEIGCRILADLQRRFPEDLLPVLASYNGGLGGVDRPGPRSYAIRVKDRYERLSAARQSLDRTQRRA